MFHALGQELTALPNDVVFLPEAQMCASPDAYEALKHAWRDQAELALANAQILNTSVAGELLAAGDRAKRIAHTRTFRKTCPGEIHLWNCRHV